MTLNAYVPALALTVTVAAVGAAQVLVSSPEHSLSGAFDRAMASRSTNRDVAAASTRPSIDPNLLQLSSASPAATLPFGLDRPVRVGDHISITGPGGDSRDLEVKSVQALPGIINTAGGKTSMLLVTCLSQGTGGETTVRFVVEAQPTPAPAPVLHHAL